METAEKKARSEGTQVPTWIVLVEGCRADYVRSAVDRFVSGLAALPQAGAIAPDTTLYQLEYTRCKTPWSARLSGAWPSRESHVAKRDRPLP